MSVRAGGGPQSISEEAGQAKAARSAVRATPLVVVALLNWNGCEDTLECVRSLQKLTYTNHQIVIVDNGSEGDDVHRLRAELGESVHLIENGRNEGYCEGNNIGMRYALAMGADYILLLNNDTIVAPDLVSHLVRLADGDPMVGIVVPGIFLYDRPQTLAYPRVIDRWPLTLSWLIGPFFSFLRLRRVERPLVIRHLDGCCFLVKRNVLEETGLLDPDYFFPGGPADLGKAAMDLGHRIVAVPEAVIWAKVARSFGDQRRGALAYAYWGPRTEIMFARKHFNRMQLAAFLALSPLRAAVWLVAYGRRARSLGVLPAIARGVRDGSRFPISHHSGSNRPHVRSSAGLSRH